MTFAINLLFHHNRRLYFFKLYHRKWHSEVLYCWFNCVQRVESAFLVLPYLSINLIHMEGLEQQNWPAGDYWVNSAEILNLRLNWMESNRKHLVMTLNNGKCETSVSKISTLTEIVVVVVPSEMTVVAKKKTSWCVQRPFSILCLNKYQEVTVFYCYFTAKCCINV